MDRFFVQPGLACLTQPSGKRPPQAGMFRSRDAAKTLDDEGPLPLPALYEPLQFEFAIGLQYRVGVNRQVAHGLLNRRELVSDLQHTQPQRPSDLLHQLPVGRLPGTTVQPKPYHSCPYSASVVSL